MEIRNKYLNQVMQKFGFYPKRQVTDIVKEMLDEERQRRSPVDMNSIQYMNSIVQLPYDYSTLIKYSLNNEVLRTVHDAIIREAVRNSWTIKPRWQRKCPTCSAEYQTDKEQCPECKTPTEEPDPEQKKALEAFIDNPNRDDNLLKIIESLLRYALAVDDMYLSIQYASWEGGRPLAVYVENSVAMRVCANEQGVLGNGDWFCPICAKDPDLVDLVFDKPGICPDHPEQQLRETAYVHADGRTIKARFSRDEIIHMQVDPWLPGHYGNSKVISCLRVLLSIVAMDKWNYDTYTTGKLAQILVFHGLDQRSVNELMAEAKKQREKLDEDPNTLVVSNKLRTLGLGTKEGVTKVDAMPPAEEMQSLDWWKLWREVVGSIYGVTPIFSGVVESGKTGNNPRMQIDVQNNTTEMYQKSIEDPFNDELLPRLGVTDWKFEFNPVEEKDEMQEITVLKTKVDTVIAASHAGMNAELTDEGEVRVSGKPKPPEPVDPAKRWIVSEPGKDEAFGEKKPFNQEQVFGQEKGSKKGRSYLVTDLDRDS